MPPLSKLFLTVGLCAASFCTMFPHARAMSASQTTEQKPHVPASISDTNLNSEAEQANAACLAAEFIVWVQSQDVQRWLRDYNSANTLADAMTLDATWSQLGNDSREIQAVLQHPAAAALRAFQNHYSVLGESFLIGASGGLVAATARTSDYWQGDEAQFVDTVELPAGQFKLFNVGLDESAHAMLAKLAVPVYDNHHKSITDTPVGVLVLGFDQVVVDFERPCR